MIWYDKETAPLSFIYKRNFQILLSLSAVLEVTAFALE
jgi:hypothetical protein